MSQSPVSYKRHRYLPSVIAQAARLYFRCPLSLRLVEDMLWERGIVVSYETIRCWTQTFGPDYAGRVRRKPPSPREHWLWRAVDQDDYVLDEIVQTRRNTKAARRLLIRLMKQQGWCFQLERPRSTVRSGGGGVGWRWGMDLQT